MTPDFSMLDNPIWFALTTRQSSLNRGKGLAVCYPPDVSRFVALAEPSPEAFADLADVIEPDHPVALVSPELLEMPLGWQLIRTRLIDQMICPHPKGTAPPHPVLKLTEKDVPEMLALAAVTEPGPFSPSTISMGRYFGIRSDDGRLASMTGERMRLDGFTEISAVCTDPDFRGKGYAKTLVVAVAAGAGAGAMAEGCIPFLHVKTENGAKGLYEALGFYVRRPMHLTVLKRL